MQNNHPVSISSRDQRLYDLRMAISEVSPIEAFAMQEAGAEIIDVREPEEMALGSPVDAHRIVRGFLELAVEQALPNKATPVLVMCGHGVRSLFAAEDLMQLGYDDVRSIAGGYQRWRMDGLPVEIPHPIADLPGERLGGSTTIPEMGEAERLRLREARVLVVGAGPLGASAALSLAGAGVGTIGLVDDSNLERTDPRRPMLEALHPAVQVVEHPGRLSKDDVEEIFGAYDLVLDGSEDLPTRYLVHDACVKLDLPCVHGSVRDSAGLVSTFWPSYAEHRGPCYRCLQPTPSAPTSPAGDEGLSGVLPGVMGSLCTVEVIKLLLDVGNSLVGRVLHIDALSMQIDQSTVTANPVCTHCREGGSFPGYADYQDFCAVQAVRSQDKTATIRSVHVPSRA